MPLLAGAATAIYTFVAIGFAGFGWLYLIGTVALLFVGDKASFFDERDARKDDFPSLVNSYFWLFIGCYQALPFVTIKRMHFVIAGDHY